MPAASPSHSRLRRHGRVGVEAVDDVAEERHGLALCDSVVSPDPGPSRTRPHGRSASRPAGRAFPPRTRGWARVSATSSADLRPVGERQGGRLTAASLAQVDRADQLLGQRTCQAGARHVHARRDHRRRKRSETTNTTPSHSGLACPRSPRRRRRRTTDDKPAAATNHERPASIRCRNGARSTQSCRRRKAAAGRATCSITAGILLAILILQNLQEVEVKFLLINTTIPLIFALLIVGALGALIGWAAPRVRRGGPRPATGLRSPRRSRPRRPSRRRRACPCSAGRRGRCRCRRSPVTSSA